MWHLSKVLLPHSKNETRAFQMSKILITGMSGTGKSSVLLELAKRGHQTFDTDSDEWCEWTVSEGKPDWIWREEKITELLTSHSSGMLFVAGCKSNQGQFYPQFDAVVLLSAPREIILKRIATRDTNNYGKNPLERQKILEHLEFVEPLLRATASVEIDASKPLSEVADEVVAIGAVW
jgi:dephospho-CoA kinase